MVTESQLENEGGAAKVLDDEEEKERKICIFQAGWLETLQ